MTRPIGYYVHHHGDGHRQRALAIGAFSPERVVLLGTGLAGRTANLNAIDLPDDRLSGDDAFDGDDRSVTRAHALHYAPMHHDGVRRRSALVSNWIAQAQPALIVVDVSVEIAMLATLCATPVAYVRLSGRRDDAAHLEAFRAAKILVAPFDARLDDPSLPQWVRDKTFYCSGIASSRIPVHQTEANLVLVVTGKGGLPCDGERLADAAAHSPETRWRAIGPCNRPGRFPGNLEIIDWTDDPAAELARAELVIGAAGDGLVNLVIAAGKPFVCIPEARPWDEQVQKAAALRTQGAAIILDAWPYAYEWPDIFGQARRLDPLKLRSLGDDDGARKTFALLQAIADDQK